MTSIVIVHAHCSPDKEVHVTKSRPSGLGFESTTTVLQDGETNAPCGINVYDDYFICVKEVTK